MRRVFLDGREAQRLPRAHSYTRRLETAAISAARSGVIHSSGSAAPIEAGRSGISFAPRVASARRERHHKGGSFVGLRVLDQGIKTSEGVIAHGSRLLR